MKLSIIILMFTIITSAQTIYEVVPGTKANEIKLTVVNTSETNSVRNVSIALTKSSASLDFNKEIEKIKMIEAKAESKVKFEFDVNRNAPVNKKDTIDFTITYQSGNAILKSLIINYMPPEEFRLEQNFPNPFNPITTIQYQIPSDSKVTLKVYDVLGAEVMILVNEEQEAGYKEVKFNAGNLASGMYIYRLVTDNYSSTKKLMLLK